MTDDEDEVPQWIVFGKHYAEADLLSDSLRFSTLDKYNYDFFDTRRAQFGLHLDQTHAVMLRRGLSSISPRANSDNVRYRTLFRRGGHFG